MFCIFLLLRLPGLGTDISNSDSLRWHRRSERFLDALKQGDFKQTYQHYQPGVTLMWVNSFVKQVGFSYQLTYTDTPKTLENADWFPIIHGFSKAVLVAFNAMVLVYTFYLIKKLWNFQIAAFFIFVLALEPYVIGIDRYFHLTSLETYLSFAAFLSALVWYKNSARKYLILSSLFLTLSILAKTSTGITLPIYLVLFALKFIKEKNYDFLYFGISTFFFGFLFFPAFWVDFIFVVQKLVFGVTNAISDDSRNFYTGYFSFFFYPLVLFFKTSPIFFVSLIFSLVTLVKDRKTFNNKMLIFYFLLYFISFSISVKKIDRYSFSLIIPLALFVAQTFSKLNLRSQRLIIALYVVFSFWSIVTYFPVFSAYYSPLGGNSLAKRLNIFDNSGEYFAQAAIYLNKFGRDVVVYVPHNIETFSPFFKGELSRSFTLNTDYIVVSSNRLSTVPPECGNLHTTFGNYLSNEVFIYECYN